MGARLKQALGDTICIGVVTVVFFVTWGFIGDIFTGAQFAVAIAASAAAIFAASEL